MVRSNLEFDTINRQYPQNIYVSTHRDSESTYIYMYTMCPISSGTVNLWSNKLTFLKFSFIMNSYYFYCIWSKVMSNPCWIPDTVRYCIITVFFLSHFFVSRIQNMIAFYRSYFSNIYYFFYLKVNNKYTNSLWNVRFLYPYVIVMYGKFAIDLQQKTSR